MHDGVMRLAMVRLISLSSIEKKNVKHIHNLNKVLVERLLDAGCCTMKASDKNINECELLH